ncbi:SusC/RagA family TonB-linked outer membrane protein [Flavihumibacter stibioxidans]|uniref:SusC/RagA family TonB-linked outer membrane protein n=1 Tax=Flavihumibacter stibioxidans TaxID=1834163 RepID=UPI001C9D6F8F|nr:SusC/RagA family TonB-linked outer membrane protein [Flavihumibacter stibioxidans]
MFRKLPALAATGLMILSAHAVTAAPEPIRDTLLGTRPAATSANVFDRVIGTVRDNAGFPLPGASINVKGSNRFTVTNNEGRFSIEAGDNAVLVISMVGFETREIPATQSNLGDIILQKNVDNLNDVVVTAIGIKQQKRKLGYSTQEVGVRALAQAKTTNLGNALTGQVAGLTVNNPTGMFQAPNFSLRGKNPIIVVDGVPIESDLFDLNSNNIENINVLKGTTASALYGSRGKNGAILITTKNAKKEGLEINFGNKTMVTAGFTVFPETQTQYGNGSEGKYEFWDGNDGGISDGDMIWGPKFGTGAKVAQWNSPIRDKQTGETIPWWGDVAGSIYDNKSRYERVPTDWNYHNNLKDFLGTGVITETNFSASYRGEKSRYYFSANHAYQKGQVPNSSLQTGNLTFNSSFNLTDKLELSANLSYNKVYSPNFPRYGYGPKNHMYTILIWMGDDVNGADLKAHMYRPDMIGYRQANYNYAWYNNPYFAAYELNQKHDRDVLNSQLKLTYQLAPGLTLQGRLNARSSSLFENMESPKTYLNYGDSRNGDYKNWNTKQLNVDADFLASYNKKVNDNISFGVTAGAASLYRKTQNEYQSTDGLIQPFLYSLNNTAGPVMASNNLNEKAIRSVYGTVNLDLYRGIYLNATGRQDWSSTIPDKPYFYPSVSMSTVLSEFVNMPAKIDFLKLNASWASVLSDLDPYSLSAAYNKSTTFGTMPSVTYPAGLFNRSIAPEKSTSFEVGMSTAFFKNRLSADLTYYHTVDENQIINLPTSVTSGFTSRKVNGNVYKTNGFEVVINAKPVVTGNFKWNTTLNWSRYVKRLTDIYNDERKSGNLFKGDRADSYYTREWEKSASGELILNSNGMPTRNPYLLNLGHLEPNWRIGFLNSFRIKDFTVDIDIDGAWGGIMRSLTHEKMWWGGKHPESVEYRDAEYAAGQPVYVPAGVIVTGGELKRDIDGNVLSDTRTYTQNTKAVSWQSWAQNYPYRNAVTESESKKFANIFDRTFMKLRRVSIGYDLTKVVKLKKVNALDVSVYGYNLLVWKKIPYLDPDFGNDDNLQDPSARYIGVSFNFKF